MEHSEIRRMGKILKDRRLQLGYTQEYAAEQAGISYSYYTKIERGQQLPSLEIALLLAKTFHLSLDYWLLNQIQDINLTPAELELIHYARSVDNQSIKKIQSFLQKASLVEKHE